MRAVQYRTFGAGPEVVDVDRPVPGPGFPDEMPQTLGHEPAGVVEELGEGATGVEVGDAVIDATGDLALAAVSLAGVVVSRGAGGVTAKVGFMSVPHDVAVSTSLWGRRSELVEVVEMAKRGQVDIHTTTYPIEEAPAANQLLDEAKIIGRAIVVP